MSKLKRKFGQRMKYNYKRTFFVLFLFLLLGGFGLVYSYLTTNLSIDGTSNVKSARWDVHFANVQVESGSVEAETPTISNQTTVNFSATLSNPGDYYSFTVDLVNSGTLNAKIDEINITPVLTEEQKNYFDYTVNYSNGLPLRKDDTISAGSTETIKITFRYLTQADSSLYPSDDVDFDFSVSLDSIQGTGNPIEGYIYYTEFQTYYDYQDLIDDYTENYFVRQFITGDGVSATHGGFIYNNNDYYVQSGGSSYNSSTGTYNSDSEYYQSNKQIMQSIFGSSNCSESEYGGVKGYYCSPYINLHVTVHDNGLIEIMGDSTGYSIFADGTFDIIRAA